ncbi:hypothetical protein O3P69_014396 [Scylla paramamosain]|uniref:Ionotropic glutamate receptor C-terminal domain-containing protein n=1 Tax=Scylla paramamosain TaxID=85552 RepID=A0AAW0TCD4_SCYPA
MSPIRAEVADFTIPLWSGRVKIVGGRGGLETDPWGFLLPLTPVVWAATLITLLMVCAILLLPSSFLLGRVLGRGGSRSVRVLLQQGEASMTVLGPYCQGLPCVLKVSVLSGSSSRAIMKTNSASLTPNADVVWPVEWWWWERLVLGLWMLTTLVLTKSYAGNLMSLLAVKYLPQPFQTLQDAAKSGVFHEVAELEKEGRLLFHGQAQFPWSLDTFVRRGRHVLADADITITSLLARDYSTTGRCDFYLSRDGFLPFSSSLISHKTDPLIQSIDRCDSSSHLYCCTVLSLRELLSRVLQIVYVLLSLGLGAGAVVLLAEIVAHYLT